MYLVLLVLLLLTIRIGSCILYYFSEEEEREGQLYVSLFLPPSPKLHPMTWCCCSEKTKTKTNKKQCPQERCG
jgi:hypothetical protein